MKSFIVEPVMAMYLIFYKHISIDILLVPIIILIYYIIYYLIVNSRKDLFKFCIMLEYQFLISAFIYSTTEQRSNTIVLIFLFFVWTRDRTKEKNNILKKIYYICLKLLLLVNILNGLIFCFEELNYEYSSAKEIAEYMNKNFDKNSIILVGNQPEYCISIIAYTDLKFYFIPRGKYYTYAVYDDINKKKLNKDFIEEIENKFKENENLYYIYSKRKVNKKLSDKKIVKDLEKKEILVEIYESSKKVLSDEEYIIYKLNKGVIN